MSRSHSTDERKAIHPEAPAAAELAALRARVAELERDNAEFHKCVMRAEAAEKRSLDWWFAATTLRELDQRQNALTDYYYADESEEVQVYNDTSAAIRTWGEKESK